jgi:hypothetical protein
MSARVRTVLLPDPSQANDGLIALFRRKLP